MSFKNKNILAVIPARGGSKGVLRKNLRQIHGKSLITHAADCVNQLSWIDAVVLSTKARINNYVNLNHITNKPY